MFNALKRFFDDRVAPGNEAVDAVTRLHCATAALMLEIAWADDDFAPAERSALRRLLGERFGLSVAEIDELVEAAAAARRDSTDLYGFTRLLKEQLPRTDLLTIVGMLWDVVYADGSLEAHEDALVHKLGRLLGLKHAEIIALKLRAKGNAEA
jgi:uncharacterized tellurite resistance protein B-like protein